MGGVIYLFTKDKNGEAINYFLLLIVSTVPLFILWAMSFVTASYDGIPKNCSTTLSSYINKILEIERLVSNKYLDTDVTNSHPDYYLEVMQNLLSDEMEKKESIINYLLCRTRLADSRGNELILIEGEIDYYSNLRTIRHYRKLRLSSKSGIV